MAEVVRIQGTAAEAEIRNPLAAFGLVLTLGIYYRAFQRIEAAQELSGTSQRVNVWLAFGAAA